MKITLEVELDLPDFDATDDELREIVWDHYVHFATKHHLLDAMQWMGKEGETAENIRRVHNTWAEICEKATFKIRREATATSPAKPSSG